MKDVLSRLTLEHLILGIVSLISAFTSIKQNVGLPSIQQIMNPIVALMMAGIAGYISRDAGLPIGIQSGIAWASGQFGNQLSSVILTALRIAERDPLKFAKAAIALMWYYMIPKFPIKNGRK